MGSFKPNQRTIEQFLLNLMRGWNSEETLEVRCIRENSRPHSMRFKPDKYLDAVQYIVAKNNTDNIYVCVNPVPSTIQGSAKDTDIKRSFFAFVDGDEKGAADRARECDYCHGSCNGREATLSKSYLLPLRQSIRRHAPVDRATKAAQCISKYRQGDT